MDEVTVIGLWEDTIELASEEKDVSLSATSFADFMKLYLPAEVIDHVKELAGIDDDEEDANAEVSFWEDIFEERFGGNNAAEEEDPLWNNRITECELCEREVKVSERASVRLTISRLTISRLTISLLSSAHETSPFSPRGAHSAEEGRILAN